MRSETDHRCDGFGVGEQRLPAEVRKHVIGDTKAVGPGQSTIDADAPAVVDVPAAQLFPVCCAPEHEPFEGEQLRAGYELNLRFASESRLLEDDRFLRKPGETGALAHVQPRGNVRGLDECAVNLLGRLGGYSKRGIAQQRHSSFEAISARNTA